MDILSLQVVLSSVEGGMDVAEMFSPPRVNIQAARLGMSTGWSMDIGTTDPWSGKAWDLSDRRCQALALKLVCQHQPKFLMLRIPSMYALQHLPKPESREGDASLADTVRRGGGTSPLLLHGGSHTGATGKVLRA